MYDNNNENSYENTLNKAIKLFICTERLHHCVFDRIAARFGLHRSQHRMLMLLSRKQQAVSQKSLAEELEISPAAVAVQLKKLESMGFVTRVAAEEDSRVNNITVTEKGRALTEESRRVFFEIDKAMFADIDKNTLESFISCFEKMQDNLKSM